MKLKMNFGKRMLIALVLIGTAVNAAGQETSEELNFDDFSDAEKKLCLLVHASLCCKREKCKSDDLFARKSEKNIFDIAEQKVRHMHPSFVGPDLADTALKVQEVINRYEKERENHDGFPKFGHFFGRICLHKRMVSILNEAEKAPMRRQYALSPGPNALQIPRKERKHRLELEQPRYTSEPRKRRTLNYVDISDLSDMQKKLCLLLHAYYCCSDTKLKSDQGFGELNEKDKIKIFDDAVKEVRRTIKKLSKMTDQAFAKSEWKKITEKYKNYRTYQVELSKESGKNQFAIFLRDICCEKKLYF